MSFDPMAHVKELGLVEDRNGFEIDPAIVYPAMIAHISAVLAGEVVPAELVDIKPVFGVDPYLASRNYVIKARSLPARAWELALVARDELSKKADLELRAAALELARLWFTRALKNLKAPIFIRIKRRPDYRL